MLRIAAVESSELLFSPVREHTLFLTSAASPFRTALETLARDVRVLPWIPHGDLLMREEEILLHPETVALLRREKVQGIWLNDWSSVVLEEWAAKNGIRLLCNAFRDQERLENKISFDTFAHRHQLPVPEGCVVRTKEEAKASGLFPGVLQQPESFGSMGTFIVQSAEALDDLEHVFDGTPLLLRRFVTGLPVGVSLLVGPKRSLVSALRVQLHREKAYLGVQWLSRSRLPVKAVQALERMMEQTASALRSQGFCGIAGFDCMLTDTDACFIECNPRHSGAILQLTVHPELLHGCDYPTECLRVFQHKDPTVDAPSIPATTFEGTTIDLDALALPNGTQKIPQCGFYRRQSDTLRFDPVDRFTGLFLWTQPPDATGLYRGFAISDASVATLKGTGYTLHAQGEALLHSLEALFLPAA